MRMDVGTLDLRNDPGPSPQKIAADEFEELT
jgi:hypothetical protein